MCSAVLGDITNNYLLLPHYLHFRAQCGAASLNIFYTETETENRQKEAKTETGKQKNRNRQTEENHKQKVPFGKLAQIV